MSFTDLQSQINSLFGDFGRRRRGGGVMDPFGSTFGSTLGGGVYDPFMSDWGMDPFSNIGWGFDSGMPLLTSGGLGSDVGIGQRGGKGLEETKMDESQGGTALSTRPVGGQLQQRVGAGGLPVLRCRVNVEDKPDCYAVTAEVPGFDKENLKVNISDDNLLTISGEQRKEHIEESKDKRFLRSERTFGTVQRSLRLPRNVKKEGVTANYINGILHVDIPKVKEAESQGTPIQIA